MKRIVPLLICLLYVSKVFGQLQKDVSQVLVKKDLNLLKKYLHTMPSQYKAVRVPWKNISVSWRCSRELTPRCKESIVYIEKTVPDKNDKSTATVYTFRINLLTTNNSIIFYDFSEKKNRKVVNEWTRYGNTGWIEYFETIAKFKNTGEYMNFEKEFINLFQASVKESEFFDEKLVYGERCGIAVTNPAKRVKLNKFVESRNKAALINWLQSGNTVKQVYAVDGLWQLTKIGIKLTGQEVKMVNFVKSKRGNLKTCSGCLVTNWSVRDMTEKFKF